MVVAVFTAVLFVACDGGDSMYAPEQAEKTTDQSSQFLPKVGKGGMIWADGILFGTIGTPASFKPTSGHFDELYVVPVDPPSYPGFDGGVGAISESKPGDQDFNGGRWHVNVLREGVDPSMYSGANAVEDLDLNDFMATETYFECPLLPRHSGM